MCQDSGRLASEGEVIACPHCARDAEYARQLRLSGTGTRPGSTAGRLPRPTPRPQATEGRTLAPTEIAVVLKMLLYAGVAAAVFFLYRTDRGGHDPPQASESDAPGADTTTGYSTWEPEQ
jgi:hypothetical protein